MNQSNPPVSNRRLSPRRRPNRGTRATGHLGSLATSPNIEPGQAQPLTIPAVVVWSAPGEGGCWVGVFFWEWLPYTELRALTEA